LRHRWSNRCDLTLRLGASLGCVPAHPGEARQLQPRWPRMSLAGSPMAFQALAASRNPQTPHGS
jgi:hypothetical protein